MDNKIIHILKNNKYIKILGFFILFHFFDKYIFSLSSIPWGISYTITSIYNGMFDSRILNDILTEYNILYQINLIFYSLLFGITIKSILEIPEIKIKNEKIKTNLYKLIILFLIIFGFSSFYILFNINFGTDSYLFISFILFVIFFIKFIFRRLSNNIKNNNNYKYLSNLFLFFILLLILGYFYIIYKANLYIYINYFIISILGFILIYILYFKRFYKSKKINDRQINTNNFFTEIFILLINFHNKNKIIIFITFIFIIISISNLEINNGKILQGILPTKGYVLIGDNNKTELKDLHNKLQLPSQKYFLKTYGLNEKIKFIDIGGKGKILSDFCILWESKEKFFLSTYLKFDDKGNYNCFYNGNIEPIIVYKNKNFTFRYYKSFLKYNKLENTIYSKLFTNNSFDNIFIRDTYNIITAYYIGGDEILNNGINYYFSNKMIKYSFLKNIDVKVLDKFIYVYIDNLLNNKEINYNILSDELLLREEKLEKFYSGEFINIKNFFINTKKIDDLINIYIKKIEKGKENKILEKVLLDFKISNNTFLFKKENSNFYKLGHHYQGIKNIRLYIKGDKKSNKENTIISKINFPYKNKDDINSKIGCIEIISTNNIIYNIQNVNIKLLDNIRLKFNIGKKIINKYSCPYNYN